MSGSPQSATNESGNAAAEPDKPRLLVIGDGGVKTGFSRVLESLLHRWKGRYKIHHLAVNYRGDPYPCGWPMYPALLGGDGFGTGRLKELLSQVRPDLIFILNDIWVQARYLEALARLKPTAPVVTYTPVDAVPLDPDWLRHFSGVEACVVYTEHGRRAIGQIDPPLAERVMVIPHGVDSEKFHPLAQSDQDPDLAKRRMGLIAGDGERSFIVLNANRNQPRKRVDLTLQGFARFAHCKPPGVRLFLHMAREDLGWDLVKLGRRLGIEERLILSGPVSGRRPEVSDEELNLIYNACDVGLNTSGGEGWGLPSFEHAATGKAQVVPRHSACVELWDGAGLLLDCPDEVVQPATLVHLHFTRPEIVADALEKLYRSPDLRREVAKRCHQFATRAEYSWNGIADCWDRLFRELLNKTGCEMHRRGGHPESCGAI